MFYSPTCDHIDRLLHLTLWALLTHFDVPATQKWAKLAMSKFAIWVWCFCRIRVLGMGQFNQRGNKHYETKTIT